MNIDFGSVIKAGGIAAAVAALIGIIAAIPFVGPFVALCYCFGGFLIPIGAGVGYGYFAPGKEEIGQSAVGGALSGGLSGFLYGLFNGLSVVVISAISGSGIGDALAGGAVTAVLSVCGLSIAGLIFGAIGGAVWTLVQNRQA